MALDVLENADAIQRQWLSYGNSQESFKTRPFDVLEKIKLKSSKSSFHYHTTKNKTTTPSRLTLMKYDPVVREHVEFKETK